MSPHIKLRSEEIWKHFITRDFADRPVPASHFRKTYVRYFKEKEAQLKDASIRLRESMEKLKKEKESRTIIPLEIDPRAARSNARRKAAPSAPSGSRLIQKAIQSARAKGPLFSPKNTQFAKSTHLDGTMRPSPLDTKPGIMQTQLSKSSPLGGPVKVSPVSPNLETMPLKRPREVADDHTKPIKRAVDPAKRPKINSKGSSIFLPARR